MTYRRTGGQADRQTDVAIAIVSHLVALFITLFSYFCFCKAFKWLFKDYL